MKKSGPMFALAAAFLFGASTPLAKIILRDTSPNILAGLLYLGSGVGLALVSISKISQFISSFKNLPPTEMAPLLTAICFGGVAGPLLLMFGLQHTPAAGASMLLNMEAPLTVLLACLAFGETYGARLVVGFVFIMAGAGLLSLQESGSAKFNASSLLIVGACACWAIDNNFSKRVVSLDARAFACIKGLVAGLANLLIAALLRQRMPEIGRSGEAMLVGFLGYGLSLVFFIRALRSVGAARTSAYFSGAPFVGAILSLFLLHEPFQWQLAAAGALMAIGIYLHLTEQHLH
jgi:drug/metabolite transporter (DMT)-like permease